MGHVMTQAIGQDIRRVDGPAKVTGTAHYSGDITLPDLAYAAIVGAGIASGRVTAHRHRAGGAGRASPAS